MWSVCHPVLVWVVFHSLPSLHWCTFLEMFFLYKLGLGKRRTTWRSIILSIVHHYSNCTAKSCLQCTTTRKYTDHCKLLQSLNRMLMTARWDTPVGAPDHLVRSSLISRLLQKRSLGTRLGEGVSPGLVTKLERPLRIQLVLGNPPPAF